MFRKIMDEILLCNKEDVIVFKRERVLRKIKKIFIL